MQTAASESEYFARLGLASDPFAVGALPDFFFVGAQRRFLVQRAVHALYFSGATVLLLGADGAGKTRTLAEIEKDLKDLVDICRVDATVLMDAAQIRGLIAASLGLPNTVAVGNAELVYALERIRPADGDPQPILIAIDAAQLLSIDTLAECAALIAGAGGRLRLLLAGEADLHIAWQQAQAGAAEVLKLMPLDRGETEDYVRTRMQAAGYREEQILSDAKFNQLFELSGGNFAAIDALVPQLLQEQPAPVSIVSRAKALPMLHIGVVAALLAVVIVLVLYREGNTGNAQPVSLARPPEIAEPATKKSDIERNSIALQLPAPQTVSAERPNASAQSPSPVVPAENATAKSVAGAGDKPGARSGEVAPRPAESSVNNVSEKTRAQENKSTQEKLALEKPIDSKKDTPVKSEAPQTAVSKAGALDADAQALLAMPSSNFVLQLMGAESKATVDKFAKGAGKGLKLYVYHTQLRGKPWIIVVTGPYRDKNAAQSAVEKLPDAVRKQQPWPRSLTNVQADIRAHGGR
ncbi:MAG: SPOR domain-containing protein [Spongiibacteraceae bacterium]